VTSVVVTHDLASAYFVADRIAFLYDRRIYRVGSVEMMRSSGDPVIEEFLSAASLQPR
jgi:phospholipid/cholesterol/gamma-HCH transport system ATP-binding protein